MCALRARFDLRLLGTMILESVNRLTQGRSVMHAMQSCVLILLTATCIPSHAQSNELLPGYNRTGIAPKDAFAVDNENINLTNGNVNISIPLLHLPGRAGHDLDLNVTYNSNHFSPTGVQQTYGCSGDGCRPSYGVAAFGWQLAPGNGVAFAGGNLSIPTLTFGWTYYLTDNGSDGVHTWSYDEYCYALFSYTDETGAQHPFANRNDCQITGYPIDTAAAQHISDSSDGSHLRLDTSNENEYILYRPDGSSIHFFITTTSSGGYFVSSEEIRDKNGNVITISFGDIMGSNGKSFAIGPISIMDTLKRVVTLNYSGALNVYPFASSLAEMSSITYEDDDGNTQTISASKLQVLDQNAITVGYSGCTDGTYPAYSGSSSYPGDFEYTLSLPGTPIREFVVNLDGMGEITKVSYPAGGYTRYNYQSVSGPINIFAGMGEGGCTGFDLREIQAKYVCSNISGSCTHESANTYTPTISYGLNSTMDVTTADGKTHVAFVPSTGTAVVETDRVINQGSSTPIESIHTDYASTDLGVLNAPSPSKVTTTLYTNGKASNTTITKYTYDYRSLTCPAAPIPNYVGQCDAIQTRESVNVNEISVTGYDNTLLRDTHNTWNYLNSTGLFNLRLLGSTNTTGSSGNYAQTDYSYDKYGVTSSGATQLHSVAVARGNLSQVTRYQDKSTPVIVETYKYDDAGNVLSVTDGNTNVTTYSYNDSWESSKCASSAQSMQSAAYLTLTTNALNQKSSATFNSCSGTKATSVDANTNKTQYQYDVLNRLILTTNPTSGGTLSSPYVDSGTPSVITTQAATPDPSLVTSTYLDGLGRTSYSIAPGGAEVDLTYDDLGRVSSTSNPYQSTSDATYGITSYLYDALGRKIDQCQQNNSTTSSTVCVPNKSYKSWTYSGNTVTEKDENGNEWQRTSDAAGQLIQVLEPNGAAVLPSAETDYAYDALGNLLSVTQYGGSSSSPAANGPITRSFAYNGLSQLIASRNPETASAKAPPSLSCAGTATGTSWTNCFGYDGNGNLTSKRDNRSVSVGYSYDALNRLLSKSFNDAASTPFSCYQYDSTSTNGVGRLGNAWTQPASSGSCPAAAPTSGFLTKRSILSYDAMGRVLQEQQFTLATQAGGTSYFPTYTYDLAGSLTSSTDGVTPVPAPTSPTPCTGSPTSGKTLTFINCFDAAGRLLSVTSNWSDSTHPATLFSAPSYAAFGGLTGASYGNGLTLKSRTYDNRLRVTGEIDTGNGPTVAVPGSATVPITGTEQVLP
jgi:YD repeat-containing protein